MGLYPLCGGSQAQSLPYGERTRPRTRWERPVADPDGWDPPARPSGAIVRLDLEKAIAGLPAGARAVFVLHDVEGLRHAEIARHLGVATGTSKAQLHRARRLLREALTR